MKISDTKISSLSRRQFIKTMMMISGSLLVTSCSAPLPDEEDSSMNGSSQGKWFMPDESEPHQRTWMAFATSEEIWGTDLLPVVRSNLATIAKTIAKYEPVSMLVTEADYDTAYDLVGTSVELVVSSLDDLWMRDTGPVFVLTDEGEKAAVQFNSIVVISGDS